MQTRGLMQEMVGWMSCAVVAWAVYTLAFTRAPEPMPPMYDVRAWLEQRAYWDAVNYRRALIAKRYRGDSAGLVQYQRYMDSAYNPTYLLIPWR